MTETTESIERKIRYLNGDTNFADHMIKSYEVEQIAQGLKLIELVEKFIKSNDIRHDELTINRLECVLEESKK